MKNLAKILVLILSVALVCGMLVLVTSADNGNVAKVGDVEYPTFNEAFEAASALTEGDKVVKLIADCSVTETIAVTKDVTVDLNGYELSSSLGVAFTVNNPVNFTITGEGSIKLDGGLVESTTTVNDFTVNVIGKAGTKGIAVTFGGTASYYITKTVQGNFNFKNLDIDATSVNLAASHYKDFASMFETDNTSVNGADTTFTAVKFVGPTVGQGVRSVVNVAGKGTLTVKQSHFYAAMNTFMVGQMQAETKETVAVLVEDSFTAAEGMHVGDGSRLYIVDGAGDARISGKGWDSNAGQQGTIKFVNSTISSDTRLFCGTNNSNNAYIILDNSTVKQTGIFNPNGNAAYQTTRGFNIIYQNGTQLSIDNASNGNGGTVVAKEGTRSKVAFNSSYTIEEGCTVVYDPVGNAAYPYVVRKTDGAGTSMLTPSYSLVVNGDGERSYAKTTTDASVAAPYTYKAKGKVNGTDNTWCYYLYNESPVAGERYILSKENSDHFSSYGCQVGCKSGTLYKVNEGNGNSYIEYYVNEGDGDTAPEGYRNFLGSKDPFFVWGTKADWNSNKNTHIATYGTDGTRVRNAVLVAEMDFGAPTEKGYPEVDFSIQTRMGSGASGNSSGSKNWRINNDGSIESFLNDSVAENLVLNPIGEWNRISVVCYTDPAYHSQGGIAYVYLNGKLIGTTNFFTTDTSKVNAENINQVFFMGIRMVPSTAENHVIGSSIALDNISVRAYNNYQVEGEVDGNSATFKPEAYITGAPTEKYVTAGPIDVSGIKYTDINEAMADATALGTVAELVDNVPGEVTVTADGYIAPNGYSIKISDTSNAADTIMEADGKTIKYYDFKEAYNHYAIQYIWYNGEYGNGDQMGDYANYVFTDPVRLGNVPVAPHAYAPIVDTAAGKAAVQAGWENIATGTVYPFIPVSLAEAKMQGADSNDGVGTVFLAPYFAKDAEGNVVYETATSYLKNTTTGAPISAQFSNSETFTAYQGLKDNQTLVLFADMYFSASTTFANGDAYLGEGMVADDDYTADELDIMEKASAKLAVDLNGYDIINNTAGVNLAVVHKNTTISFYSSKTGSEIRSYYIPSGKTYTNGQRIFAIHNSSNSESYASAMDTYNAHIYIGDSKYYDSEVITIAGGVILEGINGDNSTSISAQNVIMINEAPTSGGMIMTRHFSGEIYVNNALILSPTKNHVVDLKGCFGSTHNSYATNPTSDTNGDGKKNDKDDRMPTTEGNVYTPHCFIENAVIINNGADLVSNNGDAYQICLEWRNVTTNGRLNPSNTGGRVKIHENVTAGNWRNGYENDSQGRYDWAYGETGMMVTGVQSVYYGASMTLPEYFVGEGVTSITVNVPTVSDGQMVERLYTIVNNGATTSATSNVVELPVLIRSTAKVEDAVTVTFEGLGTNESTEVLYRAGGNVSSVVTAADYNNVATKLVFTGWSNLPVGVTEDVTVTPTYKVESNITINVNLSLYSDFAINLYVPAQYAPYITNIEGYKEVTVDDVTYLMTTVNKAVAEATDAVTFTFNIVEGEYTATATATVSVAGYAEVILSSSGYTAADKQLMYYTVAYALEATKYFNETDARTIEVLSTLLTTYADAKGEELAEKTYANAIAQEVIDASFGNVFTEVTVSLDSAPKFVLTAKADYVGTVTVSYGGNEYTYEITEGNNKIVIDVMKAYNFGTTVTITAEGASGTYNLDTYAKYIAENGTDADKAIVDAFYNYVTVAAQYKASIEAPAA